MGFIWRVDPIKQLQQLQQGLRNKAQRMNKAASPLKQIVVAKTPSDTGALKKSMRIKIKAYRSNTKWVCIIGPKVGFVTKKKKASKKRKGSSGKNPAKYNQLVNKGTKYMAGRHHMDAARKQAGKKFIDDYLKALRDIIPTLMKK